ncbi:MAG TPA: ATP-binding cassette domain-containing protein, partial [Anaerolineae bacterium]|nr:ATP-binding cassette domain-containing protein [Anaerolineae bacterium]
MTEFLELRDITKSFGKVNAVSSVNLKVNQPEIIGLIGDNGAGKSTLIKIIAGVHKPDSGEIFIRGQKMDHWSVTQARAMGIETVYQDRALVVQQSIARNIFMGREKTGWLGFMNVRQQLAEADHLMRAI